MERLSIGHFSARSRLSPKALRLYQELGLLEPAAVDPDTGSSGSRLEPAQLCKSIASEAIRQTWAAA